MVKRPMEYYQSHLGEFVKLPTGTRTKGTNPEIEISPIGWSLKLQQVAFDLTGEQNVCEKPLNSSLINR